MGGCSTDTTKRKERSSTLISQSSFSFGVVPKRSKPSSPTRSSSKLKNNTNIDDLPDVVLVDILCRLPCFRFLFKCKSVCKRWSVLLSDPYLIGRFLFRLQSQNTPIPKFALINRKGEKSFPIAFKPPPLKFLTKMFVRLMLSHSLKREPVVVGACNDLVLCCATEYYQRDYICNPYTNQSVALPPVSPVLPDAPVGFICDPYYNYPKKNKQEVNQPRNSIIQDQLVNINVDYRCMVVRILPYDNTYEDEPSYKFKVEIFSFAIGEWRESTISFPRKFRHDAIDTDVQFAHSEMLYWSSSMWEDSEYKKFLIGLNPFMISQQATDGNTIKISSSINDSNSRVVFR